MWLHKLYISASGEPTLLEEIWEYLEGKYFSVDTGRYENISLGSGSLITLQRVVLGICVGLIIAAGMACYDKNKLGGFVRAIVREQALWPEKAKTLSELGFSGNRAVRMSLRSPNKLGKIVRCVEKDAYDEQVAVARAAYVEQNGNEEGFFYPQYRVDLENDHFYIPDEEHYRAETRFDNKGSGWRAFTLVCIVAVMAAVAVCFLLPDMIQLVDNMIGILTQSDKILK